VIRYFVRHPTAANLLMLIIILLGVLGAFSLQREVFPEFASDFINVQVLYKGASATEVEETICQRIEQEIEGIEGIKEVTATAQESLGMVTVEVADGYAVADVLKDVENAVDTIDNFPEDVEEPVIWEVDRLDRVCTLTLWAEQMPEKDLVALADAIEAELLALDEVSLIETQGFSEHQIRIRVREPALRAQGLSIEDVAREVAAASIDLPAGSIETQEQEIKIRVVDQRRWAEDFRNLTVKVSPEGARIPLRAVATVTDTFEDEWLQSTFRDFDREQDGADTQSHRCVNLEVNKTREEDTLTVFGAVDRYVKGKADDLAALGVHLTMWGDWSQYVRDRLGMLVKNGIYGFILVFFTLWALLDLRLSFWVAVGIPISFLGTLYALDMLGHSLNMITMFSLIMAVGIIVDDAIVIGENIYSHCSQGKPPARAAIDGVREVGLGVVASMLTTVAVFMPLLAMKGEIGKVMKVMPIGVVTALAVSLIEAFFILPHHLKHSLGKMRQEPRRFRRRINDFVEWFIRRVYGPALAWSIRRPLVPVAAVIMLFLLSVGMLAGGRLKFQLFPELDGDFLVAQVELPAGTELQRTKKVVATIEKALDKVNQRFKPLQPEGQDLIRYVSTSYGFLRSIRREPGNPESGSHLAQVVVELLSAEVRQNARCDDVLAAWSEQVEKERPVADVTRLTFEQMQVTPGGKPIDVRLKGKDLDALKAAAVELRQKLDPTTPGGRGYPGVYNVTDNLRPGKLQLDVRLKPVGRNLGIDSRELARQLRASFWGSIAEEFQRGPDTFEVEILFADEDRRSLSDLDDFKVKTPDGRMVPFHAVATVEKVREYSQIVRVDGRRTVSVVGDLHTKVGNAREIMTDLEANFFPAFEERHAVKVDLEGQRKESAETGQSLLLGFLIGLAIIFLLLSFVFQSYVEPLIVMAVIPFALVGAIAGHMLRGIDWTMPSSIGAVSLAGIVVNDSIVLVSFIKLRLAAGMKMLDAVTLAGMQRFRPVLLTSATTVAGLLPMMLETSLQAQFLIPMAISIAFGLMFATIVVLVLVPALYSILARLGWTQRIEPEEGELE